MPSKPFKFVKGFELDRAGVFGLPSIDGEVLTLTKPEAITSLKFFRIRQELLNQELLNQELLNISIVDAKFKGILKAFKIFL